MTADPAAAPLRHIGILLFDDVEELDAVGPWEVLAHWTRQYPQDGWAVSCPSRDGRAVTAAKGLVLGPRRARRRPAVRRAPVPRRSGHPSAAA